MICNINSNSTYCYMDTSDKIETILNSSSPIGIEYGWILLIGLVFIIVFSWIANKVKFQLFLKQKLKEKER